MKFKLRYVIDDSEGNPTAKEYAEVVEAYGSIKAKQYLLDKIPEAYNVRVRIL